MSFANFKKRCVREIKALAALGYFFVFVCCAFAMADAVGDFEQSPFQAKILVGAVLVSAAWVFIIAIHELGHASAAWLLGWRVPVIAVRRITIWPSQMRIWYGLPAFPNLGGGILAVPKTLGNLRWSFAGILFGGAAANFLLATIVSLAAAWWHQGAFWPRYFDVIATLSVMTGIVNLSPFRDNTDGANILRVVRNVDFESRIRLMQISEEIVNKKRPRDWDATLVEMAQREFEMRCGDGSLGLFFFQIYLDRDDIGAARTALTWATEKLGKTDAVKISQALLFSYFDRDAKSARKLLETVKSRAIKRQPGYLIALAAVEWASGDAQALGPSVERARDALRRAPFSTKESFEFLDELAIGRTEHKGSGEPAVANS